MECIWHIQETEEKPRGLNELNENKNEAKWGQRGGKSQPRNAISHNETFYLTGSKMGRPWKVQTEEWQSMTSVFNGIEASVQKAEWT